MVTGTEGQIAGKPLINTSGYLTELACVNEGCLFSDGSRISADIIERTGEGPQWGRREFFVFGEDGKRKLRETDAIVGTRHRFRAFHLACGTSWCWWEDQPENSWKPEKCVDTFRVQERGGSDFGENYDQVFVFENVSREKAVKLVGAAGYPVEGIRCYHDHDCCGRFYTSGAVVRSHYGKVYVWLHWYRNV